MIEADYEHMSRTAAAVVADLVRARPYCVLGLATGSTPLGLYDELVRMSAQGLDFSDVTTFNLDEYFGIGPGDERSYHHFMEKNLFGRLTARPRRTYIPDGLSADPAEFCDHYERLIADAGGIDLQILGIGRDGHIGFNEPGSSLGSRTRLKTLAAETLQDNARFFGAADQVPEFAITMGVGTIFEARRCLLMASGAAKASVVAQAIEGPVTSWVTASALQLHRDATVVVDEEAASGLERLDYYKRVERKRAELMAAGKPLVAAAIAG